MIKSDFVINNEAGLHLRPCQEIAKISAKYQSELKIVKDGNEINGKSMMMLMTLAAEKGTKLELTVNGEDEKVFFDELKLLFDNNFYEE